MIQIIIIIHPKKTTMKNYLLISLIFISTISAFGQDKNFDLSKYKLPDIKRHQLDFSISSDGSRSSSKTTKTVNSEMEEKNSVYSRNDSQANLSYSYLYNTRKQIFEISSYLSPNFYHRKSTEGSNTILTSNPDLNFNAWGAFSLYKNGSKLFLHVQPYLHSYFDSDLRKINNQIDRKIKANSGKAEVSFGLGIGRIEPVSDFWQSYYILEKLKTHNLLSRELKGDDIYEFATLVSKLKNKRFFDFRERKIAELTALDSFLHKQKLVQNTDVACFTTISDYWNFAEIKYRQSGSELKVLLRPGYEFGSRKELDIEKSKTHSTSLSSIISYYNHKTINLHWDRGGAINSSEKIIIDGTNEELPTNYFSISAGMGYDYLPNFRTSISSRLHYEGSELVLYGNDMPSKHWVNSLNLNIDVKYYVSPQFQVSASVNSSFRDKSSTTTKNVFYTYYSLGLNYAIF